MFAQPNEVPQFAEHVVQSCPARQEQRRRNAAARRKLEALRERRLLLKHLTDVWDEPGGQQ
jgi:hypothetical protein